MGLSWRHGWLTVAIGILGMAACATGEVVSTGSGSGGDGGSGNAGAGAGTTTTNSGGAGTGGDGGSGGSGGMALPCGVDCSTIQTEDCQEAVCDMTTLNCTVIDLANGTTCDDDLFCTINDSCVDGACLGGGDNDCGLSLGACDAVTCDEASKGCSTTPKPNGDPCSNPNDLCQVNTTCQNGLCIGDPKDCFFQPVPDDCHVAECNPMNGMCEPVPGNEGQPCTDAMDLCTVNKTCLTGMCQGGSPKDCSALTQGCNLGVCDSMSGQCTTMGVNDGDPCDDIDACTTGELCSMGQCSGGTPITQCVGGDSCCPAGCTDVNDIDCALPFNQPTYNAVTTFTDSIQGTSMMLTWDGTYLWNCSGGGTGGVRLAQYDAVGNPIMTFSPGIDFRATFTKGDGMGPVYARPFGNMQLRVQTAPGVFANDITLAGSVDSQSGVVWDSTNSIYVALDNGTLKRWNASGAAVGDITFQGFGSMNTEGSYPQNRGVATVNGFYLTYVNGVLSAWDDMGVRIDTTILNGAGTSFDANFSMSYAQGKVWVVDSGGGTWRGYNVGL